MELSGLEHLIYGLVSGLTEIFPVSARAHSTLILKVLGRSESAMSLFCLSILQFWQPSIFPAGQSWRKCPVHGKWRGFPKSAASVRWIFAA